MQQASGSFKYVFRHVRLLGLPGAGGKRLLAAGEIQRSAIFEETSSCRLQARTICLFLTGDETISSAEMDGRWKEEGLWEKCDN